MAHNDVVKGYIISNSQVGELQKLVVQLRCEFRENKRYSSLRANKLANVAIQLLLTAFEQRIEDKSLDLLPFFEGKIKTGLYIPSLKGETIIPELTQYNEKCPYGNATRQIYMPDEKATRLMKLILKIKTKYALNFSMSQFIRTGMDLTVKAMSLYRTDFPVMEDFINNRVRISRMIFKDYVFKYKDEEES